MAGRKRYWFLLALISGCAFLGKGYWNATRDPIVREASVVMPNWPEGQPPIKLLLVSDVHVGNIGMTRNRLTQIISQFNAVKPDIVLFTGDFLIGESSEGAAENARDLAPLSALRASAGVFAVFGNHDHWTDAPAIRRALKSAGVQVLENEAVKRGAITLVGIGDRFSGHDNISDSAFEAKKLGGTPIAFTHSPDISPELPTEFGVLLAGHTHCGQMVMPLIGPIIRYSRWQRLYNPKYRCGRINDTNRTTFVTAGIGSGAVPLRYGAHPDVWLLTLRASPSN